MKKYVLLFLFLFAALAPAFAQLEYGDTLRIVEGSENGDWKKKVCVHSNGDTAYVLDAVNCIEYYFDGTNYNQTLPESCSEKKIIYSGPGKFEWIYSLKNGEYNGHYRTADSLHSEEGEMKDGERTGWWKYTDNLTGETSSRYHFGGEYKSSGLSIGYHFIAAPILFLILLFTGIQLIRKGRYPLFYISICISFGVMLLTNLLLTTLFINSVLSNAGGNEESTTLPDIRLMAKWLLLLFLLSVPVFSIYNLFSKKVSKSLKTVSIVILIALVCLILFMLLLSQIHIGKIGG